MGRIMKEITIIKKNLVGEETWRYYGVVVSAQEDQILISARFNRSDLDFHGIVLARDDLFFEVYYRDRWYNIFEIYDKNTDALKCWYCNIARPAEISDGQVAYVDLALDLLVFPDGRQIVLDRDEFEELELTKQAQQHALSALAQLQVLFSAPVSWRLRPAR